MMHYITKLKYGFLLFINHIVLLFSIVLFCSSCFESIKDQSKKVEEYKESIDLEELESILQKDISSKNKKDDFTNCINKEKPIEKEKKDLKTSVKESIRLQTSKELSGTSIEEERKRREKEQESARQKRIKDITLLEQSMQSLGARLQAAHQSRLNREAERLRSQQETEQARLRREEERVRIEQEIAQLRIRREAIERSQQEENQLYVISESERIEQEAILESIRTEADRVRSQQESEQERLRRLPIRSPIENEENNEDIRSAIASSLLRGATPEVMSKEKVIKKLKSKLSQCLGFQNEECPICLSDFLANREDCYRLSTCCNKLLHISCIADSVISSYNEMKVDPSCYTEPEYRCPFCRSTLL